MTEVAVTLFDWLSCYLSQGLFWRSPAINEWKRPADHHLSPILMLFIHCMPQAQLLWHILQCYSLAFSKKLSSCTQKLLHLSTILLLTERMQSNRRLLWFSLSGFLLYLALGSGFFCFGVGILAVDLSSLIALCELSGKGQILILPSRFLGLADF